MIKFFIIIGILNVAILSNSCFGQSVEIDLVQFYKEKVIITYSLKDPKSRAYSVSIFSSKDNFAKPLIYVTGDVGNEVFSGQKRKIIWDAKKELGDFKGDISFQISCHVLEDFLVTRIFKRGKNYQIRWNAVNSLGQNIKIELINSEQEKVWEDSNAPNTGHYNWKIPARVKKGDGYKLRFTNIENAVESNVSNSFEIRPRIPFLAKAIGTVVVGGAAIVLIGSTGRSGSDPLPEFSSIGFPNK